MKEIWFKRKRYGWGWRPVTWQGWVVVIFYIALISLVALTVDQSSSEKEALLTFALPLTVLTALLVVISYRYGEKPRWQWGPKQPKDKEE